jgi:hypothetical protein
MPNYSENNLIPVSKKSLLKGQRVIKIGDNYFPIGIGGNVVPSYQTGSVSLYKCDSVDELNNKWYGYSAKKNSGGYYEYETELTELSYDLIVPEVGKVYSEDCLIQISNLYTGTTASYTEEHLSMSGAKVDKQVLKVAGVKVEDDMIVF